MVVQLAAVYGEWRRSETKLNFEVDHMRGGRMFFLNDDDTHEELVRLVKDEFNIDKISEVVELTYALPEAMLQQMGPDTPHMHVTNDSQVRNLINLCKMNVIRLCVSSCLATSEHQDKDEDVNDVEDEMDGAYEEDGDDADKILEEDNLDDILEENNVDEVVKDENNAGDETDDEYEVFGKVKDEDEEDISFGAFDGNGGGRGIQEWQDKIFVNQSFDNKEELQRELRLTAVMLRFSFAIDTSTRTKFVAVCRVKGCKWRVRASVKNEPERFWVSKYVKLHTCSTAARAAHRKKCTPKYIGRLFIERVGIINGITPQHIQEAMNTMFSMKLDYTTSYRSLLYAQAIVRGTAEDGYATLPSYLKMISEANPGTVTGLELAKDNKFKYLFISFGASIAGFQYLRRVIVVDGTHLSGKYEGVMLVACAQDGNFQIFPLAFGIVDSENDASWEWFFTKLRLCISDQYPLVIVSDRHISIKHACEKVFPWATRGICYYHLQNNIIKEYHAKDLMYLVKLAAYAYTLDDYDRYMAAIRASKPTLADYLEKADPKLWSRVHCEGERYNLKTSNIAESINSALKVARGYPIAFLLEFIRQKLTRWFCKRRADAASLTTPHTRGVEYLLAVRDYEAAKMTVARLNDTQFHVKGGKRDATCDLMEKKCTCGLWYCEKIVCSHAIAAYLSVFENFGNGVCGSYRRESLYATYAYNIYPINGTVTRHPTLAVMPPDIEPKPGRKKKSRWQTWLEQSRKKWTKPRKIHNQYNCSTCKQPGHTAPNCVQE